MTILAADDISLSFGQKPILENVSFQLEDSDRCGLIGINGSGKTTLLSIMSGDREPDAGRIRKARGLDVGYLRQTVAGDAAGTVGESVNAVYADLIEAEAAIERMENEIETSNPGDEELSLLVKRLDAAREAFDRAGGYEYRSRIKGALAGLDVLRPDRISAGGDIVGVGESTPVKTLSGGQKTRLALATLLMRPPSMLILDEPTNHLDVNSLEWLENYLRNFPRCFVVVSHDRYFLDAVTNRTLELDRRKLKSYKGSYTRYLKLKAEDDMSLERAWNAQQLKIKKLESIIAQQKQWNTERSIITAGSKQKALDRIDRIERPKGAARSMNALFSAAPAGSRDTLFAERVTKTYGGVRLFEPFTAAVYDGDRVVVTGPNGSGKSTLLRVLAGRLRPDPGGVVELGARTKTAYYDQENAELTGDKTVFDELRDERPDKTDGEIRSALASFLFFGDDCMKTVGSLSGGEKARLALAKLVQRPSNTLLLDEPTNHLDIPSREALESALERYEGVVIAVSHDRYFISKLANRIFGFVNGRVEDFRGSYEEYASWKSKSAEREDSFARAGAAGRAAAESGSGCGSGSASGSDSGSGSVSGSGSGLGADSDSGSGSGRVFGSNKERRIAERELRAQRRRDESKLARAEARIETIEREIADIDRDMSKEDVATDHERLVLLLALREEKSRELDDLLEEWETLSTRLSAVD